MNKAQLADRIAAAHSMTKAQAMDVLNTTLGAIVASISDGEDVALHGFGTFKKVHKPERSAVNPATREPVTVAAKDVPQFKPSGAFEVAVNGGKTARAAA